MNIGVTGGCGFLGTKIVNHLRSSGHNVVRLSRNNCQSESSWRFYSLQMPAPKIDLAGLDVIVHCAFDMNAQGSSQLSINGTGAAELAEACRREDIYLVNISSVLAANPKLSWYSRAKHSVEKSVLGAGGTNLRLGVLTDFDDDPFARRVKKLIKKRFVVFLPVPNGWVWQSSVASLLSSIEECLLGNFRNQTRWLGGSHPLLLSQHVAQICDHFERRLHIIKFPLVVAIAFLWPIDRLSRRRSTFSVDALKGLKLPVH
jgi:uncharacterized protein YbjT (DUF2867 family)